MEKEGLRNIPSVHELVEIVACDLASHVGLGLRHCRGVQLNAPTYFPADFPQFSWRVSSFPWRGDGC